MGLPEPWVSALGWRGQGQSRSLQGRPATPQLRTAPPVPPFPRCGAGEGWGGQTRTALLFLTVWCWKPRCLLCPVPLAWRRVRAESPAPPTPCPPSSPSPLAWKEQGRRHRRPVDAHSPCTVGPAAPAPAILGATAGLAEAQVSPRCRSHRQRDVPQPVPGCSKPSLFGCCLNRYQGFPTREWCRAMVPWLSQPGRGWPGRAAVWATGAACDAPWADAGGRRGSWGGKRGKSSIRGENLRAGDVTAGGGKGLSCSGRRRGWGRQGRSVVGPEGLPGRQSGFPRGGCLRPGPAVPPPGRAAVASDAVKQQQGGFRGGDGVTYKPGETQPRTSSSPRGG